jgi:hypothetical protein
MVAWKMQTLFSVLRLTMVHSYSKKMLESGDNQIKRKRKKNGLKEVKWKWGAGRA